MRTSEEAEKNSEKKKTEQPITPSGPPQAAEGRAEDQEKPEAEPRRRAHLKTLALRVGAIVHRNPATRWSEKENRALAKLSPAGEPVSEEDLVAVECYYAAHWPPKREVNILRHDLATLLNNWPGEVDRAKTFASKNGNGSHLDRSDEPTPQEVSAWLDTRPDYAKKRGEWTTWGQLPRFAKDEFAAYRKANRTTAPR